MGGVKLGDSIMLKLMLDTLKPTMQFLVIILFFSYACGLIDANFTPTTTTKPITTMLTTVPVKTDLLQNSTPLNGTRSLDPNLLGNEGSELHKNATFFSFFSKIPGLGSPCNTPNDCSKLINSTCVSGSCQCAFDFVSSSNNRTCLKKAKKLEDTCFEDVQCESIYGISGLTVCLSYACVCSPNANFVNNNCYKKTVLGSDCKVDEECSSIPYSYCLQGICACDPDFAPDINGTHCYPINGTGDGSNIDCSQSSLVCKVLGKDSYCLNGTCVCYPGYHLDVGKCVPEKKLGDVCDSNEDCRVDMEPKEPIGVRVCRSGVCSCTKGYKVVPDHNICKSIASVQKVSLLLVLISLVVAFNKLM